MCRYNCSQPQKQTGFTKAPQNISAQGHRIFAGGVAKGSYRLAPHQPPVSGSSLDTVSLAGGATQTARTLSFADNLSNRCSAGAGQAGAGPGRLKTDFPPFAAGAQWVADLYILLHAFYELYTYKLLFLREILGGGPPLGGNRVFGNAVPLLQLNALPENGDGHGDDSPARALMGERTMSVF